MNNNKQTRFCEVCKKQLSARNQIKFCSQECYLASRNAKPKTLRKCIECEKETYNPSFCSRTCAAKYNNAKNPKRKKRVWHCEKCGCTKERPHHKAHICYDCKDKPISYKYITIGDLRSTYLKRGWHRQNVYTYIREQSKRIMKKLGIKSCFICGYNKHVEACHKTTISSYPDNTLISEINSLDNLIALCPNCHWEFDHGLLKF